MEATSAYPLPWWATAQKFFSCVYLAIIRIYAFCVWSRKATKVIHVGVSVAGNFLLRVGQARLRSSGIDAANILYIVFLNLISISYWYNAIVMRKLLQVGTFSRVSQSGKKNYCGLHIREYVKVENKCWGGIQILDDSVEVKIKFWWGCACESFEAQKKAGCMDS